MKSAFSTTLPRQSSARKSPVMTLASPKEEAGSEKNGEHKLPTLNTSAPPLGETIGHRAWLDALGALEAQLSKAMARKNKQVAAAARTAPDGSRRFRPPPPLPQPAPVSDHEHVTPIGRAKLRVIEDLAEIELARENGKTSFLS